MRDRDNERYDNLGENQDIGERERNKSSRGESETETRERRKCAGLDIRLVGPVARGASRFENSLAPQKIYWPPKKTRNICVNLQFKQI